MIYYDYHLIIKELAEEFKGQLHILPNPFSSNRKKKKELIKMEKGLQKPYPTEYHLLITQYLWKVHYQILLIILLKEFIKLNVNMDMIIKSAKRAELNTKIVSFVLNIQTLNMI